MVVLHYPVNEILMWRDGDRDNGEVYTNFKLEFSVE
jgi:hypothetical protein